MTDREKAIVMAYTGIAMLTGEKIDEFYKYLAELYGRPVYTHEISTLDIQDKAKPDFVELCRTEQPSADSVEVVRCRECKHYQFADNRAFGMPVKMCEWFGFEDVDDDDFCSRGERRNR